MSENEVKKVTFGDKSYALDSYGFLDPSDQWDENFAEGIAEQQGIFGKLTEAQWDFVKYLRRKFIDEKTVPVVVIACSENDLRLADLRHMFPTGYHRGACRIAGINYEFMYKTNYWLTYETTTVPKEEHKTTIRGFLKDFDSWNERFAEQITRDWKLPQGYSERHKEIVGFLRDYYKRTEKVPNIFEVCKDKNLDLEELRKLFPDGYRRGACRMAGLPFYA